MQQTQLPLKGFSKLSNSEKIGLISQFAKLDVEQFNQTLNSFHHTDNQSLFDQISENTLSNYLLPYGIAPNFLIDEHWYFVPMVTEESSVIAAASKAASFWANRGGFKTHVSSLIKNGQIHFYFDGDGAALKKAEKEIIQSILPIINPLLKKMEERSGGYKNGFFSQTGESDKHLWQLSLQMDTANAMGANFINTCLEKLAPELLQQISNHPELKPTLKSEPYILMCILSNYTPECLVECMVECHPNDLTPLCGNLTTREFLQRFEQAVYVATFDEHRAATHNKGIFNGIDAVMLATGNDFRAVEANGHTHAARTGQYRSLSRVSISKDHFSFSLSIPLSVGTVGGLTTLHPLAKLSLQLLENPNATQLMSIAASVGLANNFMAITSLITSGIQKGHMKMHLSNILVSLNATPMQIKKAQQHFKHKTISVNEVQLFLQQNKTT